MYSSTTLWTAAIASCTRAQTLRARQWLGVLCLTAGLVVNGHEQLTRRPSTDLGGGGGAAAAATPERDAATLGATAPLTIQDPRDSA
jgi:hypothetical protein